MDLKNKIILSLRKILKDLAVQGIVPQLEHPADEGHGDYSSNIALVASKILRKNPFELAEKIKNKLPKREYIEKIELVRPGFINFWISKKYLLENIESILGRKDDFGNSEKNKDKKIMVEFTDPNPFKEFHIGHLYSNIVGESISRLIEASGAIVKRANYQGDVGMHVAKALYGIQNLEFGIQNLEGKGAREEVKFLGEAYALGTKAYEQNENKKSEIEQLNKKIYDKDPEIVALYQKARQWSLEYFEQIYKRLGTRFDFYYFESEVGKDGLELVKEYLKKGVFVESKGAVIFPGEKYARLPDGQGLHNRVFINSLGLPTYEAKELGLALRKYQDFAYDESIIITGNEIIAYFKVLLVALRSINSNLAQKTRHISHGMVRLPIGKMSSRTGNVITGEWLIEETKRLIGNQYKEMQADTLEKVAMSAVKYGLLKSGMGRDIEFNFLESISLEGNSGPYIQYAFARTQSVLAKVKSQKSKVKITDQNLKVLERLAPEELSLLRTLYRFPEVVEEAAESFAPNILCNYLFDLAKKFNLFYQKVPILKQELNKSEGAIVKHPEGVIQTREFRLALTKAVGQILKNGLNLLGIQAPEKM